MDRTSFGLPDPAADPPQGERRRSVRQKLHTPVYVSFNGPQTGLVVDLSELLDLNEDGFGVQTAVQGDDRLEANRVISLCLDLSETKSYVHGSGHVVWSDPTGRAGIRFSYLPDSAKIALKEWLFRNLLVASSNHASRVEQRAHQSEESHEHESPAHVLDVDEPVNGRALAGDVQSLAASGEALASRLDAATPTGQQRATHRSSITSLDVLRHEVRDLGDDADAVIQRITTGALDLTGATGAALAFITDGVMICRARAGSPAPPIGAIVDTKAGLSGECVRTGHPVLCSDSENDARVDADLCRMLGLRSLLAVPIFADFRVAGLLEVFSPSANAFTEAHEIILDRLVELVPYQPARIAMRVTENIAVREMGKSPGEIKQTGTSISVQPDPLQPQAVSTTQLPTRDEGFTARNIREALRQQPSKVQVHPESPTDAAATKISQHSARDGSESDTDLLSTEASRARKAQVILLGSVIAVVAVVFGYVLAPTIERRLGGHVQSAPTSAQAASSEASPISSVSWPANHRAQDVSLEDLHKQADQGVAEAQWRLGVLYHNGEGVPQSDAQAVEWFLRSANQGYVPAQATLGAYYWAGRGVPQDFSKAYFWSQLALAQGDENSKSRLEGLAAQMTHTQVTNARQQAEAWLQAHNQPLRSASN